MSLDDIPLCPISRTAIIIGSKWTPMILRELLLHSRRRYQDLLESLPGIAPNTLSHRLKLLEKSGIVIREFYAENPPRAEYVITEKGRATNGVILAMREWGEKFS
jgi:DNA-binding HxlR family transcriptional regulator